MKWHELISSSRELVTVQRVYGAPYERDGIAVIPAAEVVAGGGGGGGEDTAGGGSGGGGGLGFRARPVGAFVIEGGQVRWQPVMDVSRMVLRGMLAACGLALLVRRARR